VQIPDFFGKLCLVWGCSFNKANSGRIIRIIRMRLLQITVANVTYPYFYTFLLIILGYENYLLQFCIFVCAQRFARQQIEARREKIVMVF
jgi:hypothetical protein